MPTGGTKTAKNPTYGVSTVPLDLPSDNEKYQNYKDWRDDQGDSWHQSVS